MAVTTVLFWVSLVLTVIGSNGSGELNILHNPKSMKFSGSSEAMESTIKEIYSAALGLSVEENTGWTGMTISDPFATAKAVVQVYVDGIASISDYAGLKSIKYPIILDSFEPDTFEVTKHRIKQRYTNEGGHIMNINLNDPNEVSTNFAENGGNIGQLNLQKQETELLKYDVIEDMQFLNEIAVLKAIAEQIKNGVIQPTSSMDLYNFRLTALHGLSDFHGPKSPQVKEAKKILGETLQQLSAAFVKMYDDSVLVAAVTTDVAHTRRSMRAKRELTQRSLEYSEDYAAIFNIILWFSVVFVFAMIAVVYSLVDMDPGRDSIIYRMTSTRMKKDN